MRDWLTVIVILLILGIALDGLRRMRAHRRNASQMTDGGPDVDADFELTSEFPSGGARVAAYRDPNDVDDIHRNLKENHAASKMTRGAPARAAQKTARAAPITKDSADNGGSSKPHREPSLGNLTDLDSDSSDTEAAYSSPPRAKSAPVRRMDFDWEKAADLDDGDELDQAYTEARASDARDMSRTEPEPLQASVAKSEPESGYQVKPEAETAIERPPIKQVKEPKAAEITKATTEDDTPAEENKPKPHTLAPDVVLIIHVMARRGKTFAGAELLQAMLDQGLRFGEMDIFHRHQSPDGEGPILFSVANMVKPGTFDLSGMESFSTPGISMFLTLPIRGDSVAAYTLMAQIARDLAQKLDGELKDENRSVMTRQTIEHDRQRVIEYERKRRLARA